MRSPDFVSRTLFYFLLGAAFAAPANAEKIWFSTLQWDGNPNTQRISTIRSIHTNGTGDSLLVDLGDDTTFPVPSSDGDWIYFQKGKMYGTPPNTYHIYHVHRIRPDGTDRTILTSPPYSTAYGLSVSRNSAKLVYNANNGSIEGVVIANADGSSPQYVAPQFPYTYMGSPDDTGERVLFANPNAGYVLGSVHVASGGVTTLASGATNLVSPQFALDGSSIIALNKNDSGNIYSFPAAGGGASLLAANAYHEFHWSDADCHGSTDRPSLSEDGQRLAYLSFDTERKCADGTWYNTAATIYITNANGSGGAQQVSMSSWPLAVQAAVKGRIRWSPDGRRLAFVARINGADPQLFVVNVDGSGLKQLTNYSGRGVYWLEWERPASALVVKNLTSKQTVFADDFMRAPGVSHTGAPDTSGSFNPRATKGTWNVYESPLPFAGPMIQVTDSTSGFDPGGHLGSRYLRIYRNSLAGFDAHDLNGVFSAAQTKTGDELMLSMMVYVPNDGKNARGQFLLSGAAGNIATARAWVRPDGAGNVVAIGPGSTPVNSGVGYTPGVRQRWDLRYVVGASTFTVAVDGRKSGPLASPSAGSVGALLLINGHGDPGSIYIGGVSSVPALIVKNATTGTTLFKDDFGLTSQSSTAAPDYSGDYDPIATLGTWNVFESPGVAAGAMIQVTGSNVGVASGGPLHSNYLRLYRSGNQGLSGQDLTGTLTTAQTNVNDVIRLSMKVLVPPDGANARGQFILVGTPGNLLTARAWVRPDGAGHVMAVGPGYAVTNTSVTYTPGIWQRWDLEYAVSSSTFRVAVDGVYSAPMTSFSSGGVAGLTLFNGNENTGSINIAGVED